MFEPFEPLKMAELAKSGALRGPQNQKSFWIFLNLFWWVLFLQLVVENFSEG